MKYSLPFVCAATTILLLTTSAAYAQVPEKVPQNLWKTFQTGARPGNLGGGAIESAVRRAVQKANVTLPDPVHNTSDFKEIENILSAYSQTTQHQVLTIQDVANAAALVHNERWVHYAVLQGADVNQTLVQAINPKDNYAFANHLFEIYRPNPEALEAFFVKAAEQPLADEKVVWLAKHGVNPNATDELGNGVLHKLAQRGLVEEQTLDALKEVGANFDLRNHLEMTPLFSALPHPLFVQALVERGANPLREDKDNLMPVQKAQQQLQDPSLDAQTAEALNQSIDILETAAGEFAKGDLFRGLRWSDRYDFQQLQARREKLKQENLPNPNEIPADQEELQQLLEEYAYLQESDGSMKANNIAKMACMSGKDRWAFVALWHGATPADVLFYALRYGRYELAEKMITQYHANPNGKIQEWGEPLPIALARSSTEGFLWLFDRFKGQLVLRTSKTSALHAAADGGQTELIVPLKEAGLDINLIDEYGHTLLGASHVGHYPDFLEKALQEGANPKIGKPLESLTSTLELLKSGGYASLETIQTLRRSKRILEDALKKRPKKVAD